MRKQRAIRAIAILATFAPLLGAGRADAAFVTVNFSGTISSVPDTDGVLQANHVTVKPGDPLTASLVYDPSAVTTTLGSGDFVTYQFKNISAPTGINLNVDGLSFQTAGSLVIQVKINQTTGTPVAPVQFVAIEAPIEVNNALGSTPLALSFVLADTTGTALTSSALPTSLNPASFNEMAVELDVSQSNSTNLPQVGPLFISEAAVPEPASAALLGIGLLGVVALGRRRRSAA